MIVCYVAVITAKCAERTLSPCWFQAKMPDLAPMKSVWRALTLIEAAVVVVAAVTRYSATSSSTLISDGVTYRVTNSQGSPGLLAGFLFLAALIVGSAVLGISTGARALAALVVELLVVGVFAPAFLSGDLFYLGPIPLIASTSLACLVLSISSLRGQRTARSTT